MKYSRAFCKITGSSAPLVALGSRNGAGLDPKEQAAREIRKAKLRSFGFFIPSV